MAQKREKEETESLPICSPPIGQLSGGSDEKTTTQVRSDPKLSDWRSSSARSPERSDLFTATAMTTTASSAVGNRMLKRPREKQQVNRCSCSGCKRKLGLMGFRCRCGDMFCSEHRYTDRHDCSYDYKAAGREAIARENPVVRAAKILKV